MVCLTGFMNKKDENVKDIDTQHIDIFGCFSCFPWRSKEGNLFSFWMGYPNTPLHENKILTFEDTVAKRAGVL